MVSLSAENSKFFGPTVTTISPLIVPYLKQYLAMLEFETAYDDHPHLFSPARDVSRAMTSSQWSAYAKAVVKKYTSVAAPPKTMRCGAAPSICCRRDLRSRLACIPPPVRASFITYMKDHTECPKILAAAARAMKHKGETQGDRARALSLAPARV